MPRKKLKATDLEIMPEGADIANPPEGYVMKSNGDEVEYPKVSRLEVFNDFKNKLEGEGITMHAHLTGQWSGFDLFLEDTLDFPGLNAGEFKYRRRLDPASDDDVQIVTNAIEKHLNQVDSGDKFRAGMWYKFHEGMTTQQQKLNTPLRDLAMGRATKKYGLTVSLKGKQGSHKVVPMGEWFPESMGELNIDDLLRILPLAERKMFMLSLGRAMVGAMGERSIEGVDINHTFRSFMLMVGYDPGLGKSWMMFQSIIPAMRRLGYNVVGITQDLNQFGFSKPAVADLVFIDDLTHNSQSRLLASAELKTMISNGELQVNEKYLPMEQVRTRAVLIGCTNHFDYSDYLDMDAGMVSRLCASATVRAVDLWDSNDLTFDYRPASYWVVEAERLGVTVELIGAWILHKSVEYFREVCGYDKDWTYDRHRNRLEHEIGEIRNNFVIDVDLTHVTDLVNSIINMLAMAIANEPDRRDILRVAKNLPFSWQLVWEFAKFGAKFGDWNNPYVEELVCESMAWSAIADSINAKTGDAQLRSRTQTSGQCFKWVMSELTSIRGFGFPSSVSRYTHRWQQELLAIEQLTNYYSNKYPRGIPLKGEFREMMLGVKAIISRAQQLSQSSAE